MIIRIFKERDAIELSELIRTTLLVSNTKDYSKKAIKVLYNAFDPANYIF